MSVGFGGILGNANEIQDKGDVVVMVVLYPPPLLQAYMVCTYHFCLALDYGDHCEVWGQELFLSF